MIEWVQIRVVRGLNLACVLVDDVAYRPVVVKLTRRLPVWWHCQLAAASIALDERWGTGYWDSEKAPACPEGMCEACRRRAAWLTVGGWGDEYVDEEDEDERRLFLRDRMVHLCSWCRLDGGGEIETEGELGRALARAGERSIAWRWRWRYR